MLHDPIILTEIRSRTHESSSHADSNGHRRIGTLSIDSGPYLDKMQVDYLPSSSYSKVRLLTGRVALIHHQSYSFAQSYLSRIPTLLENIEQV